MYLCICIRVFLISVHACVFPFTSAFLNTMILVVRFPLLAPFSLRCRGIHTNAVADGDGVSVFLQCLQFVNN